MSDSSPAASAVAPLAELMLDLPRADQGAARAVRERAAVVLRPAGAFRRLDEIAEWLAGWQATPHPAVAHPHAIIFAADHGVATEGVSAYPSEVTRAMVAAVTDGVATSAVLAHGVGAEIEVVDVGVGRPTGNLRVEPALDAARFAAAVAAGVSAVGSLDARVDLLIVGEMGIGNTTAAAALAAAVVGGDGADWVGPGTGVVHDQLLHKQLVVDDALARVAAPGLAPFDALRELGGAELVAMAAAVMAARSRRLPVVLDGFICTAAMAPLAAVDSNALDHCIAGHCSAEPGHRRLLEYLGLEPLLDLDLRLGEGSGALAAVPLVRLAAASVVDVATFSERGLG